MVSSNKKHFTIASDSIYAPSNGVPLTLDIELVPQPAPKVAWYENVTFFVAAIGLIGVLCTVWLGWWRMKKELSQALTLAKDARDYSRGQAEEDRKLAMDQANAERKHSADEAHRERIATARRIVYLDATKEVVKAHAIIGRLTQKTLTEIGSDNGLNDLSAAVAKVTILGGMNTILKSREVLNLINLTYLKALALTAPMQLTKDEISTMTSQREAASTNAENIQKKFKDLTRDGNYSQEASELAEESRILHARAVEYADAVVTLHEKFNEKHYEYIDFILNEFREIQKATDELIIMIRSELELETDTDALFQSTQNMYELAKRAAADLRDNVERLVKDY
ncbi:hypothetical protein V3C40_04090 [Janthinobacterium sp. LS2A]|uniref:hypothetical protein n=1 Tax=Janthinobacterium sp. LS2A TaxID=3118590 RepID=UPI002F953DD2